MLENTNQLPVQRNLQLIYFYNRKLRRVMRNAIYYLKAIKQKKLKFLHNTQIVLGVVLNVKLSDIYGLLALMLL